MNFPKFSQFIVSLIILLNVVFTIVVLYIFFRTGGEPVVLIGAWFSFTTGELWFLSTIKKKEVGRREHDEQNHNS